METCSSSLQWWRSQQEADMQGQKRFLAEKALILLLIMLYCCCRVTDVLWNTCMTTLPLFTAAHVSALSFPVTLHPWDTTGKALQRETGTELTLNNSRVNSPAQPSAPNRLNFGQNLISYISACLRPKYFQNCGADFKIPFKSSSWYASYHTTKRTGL